MVDINWTAEQATAAHELALAEGRPEGPNLPFSQWAALHRLERIRTEYEETGNGFAVLAGVRICANHDLVMPDWLSRAFIKHYDKVLNAHVDSWDDAFGRPYPKGTHLRKIRQTRVLPIRAWMDGKKMLATGRWSVGDEFFDNLGRRLGVARTIAKEMYYEGRRRYSVTLPENSE